METTKLNLKELHAEIEWAYINHINPLSEIREKYGIDTHFEYNNGQNEFFLYNNSFEQIQKTTNCEKDTLFVLLKKDQAPHRVEDTDSDISVVLFYDGYMCDGSRDPEMLPYW